MSLKIKVDIDYKETIKQINSIAKDLMIYIPLKAHIAIRASLPQLKSTLLSIITRMYNSSTSKDNTKNETTSNNLKKDLIKEIFGKDLSNLNLKNTDNKDDKSSTFIVRDKRIKAWQSISDSATYESEQNKFKNRLLSGLIIDYYSDKVLAPDPETIKGIKVECSTDTGETVKSSKKFDAYKNSDKITRTKSTYQRSAIWTLRQEDVSKILEKAVDVDSIVSEVIRGNYQTAQEMLRQKNKSGTFDSALSNIDNIKKGTFNNKDLENFNNLKKLINNLTTRRHNTKKKVSISLVSFYNNELEETAIDFFTEIRKHIYLWNVSNQEDWIKAIIQAIEIVAKKQNKRG